VADSSDATGRSWEGVPDWQIPVTKIGPVRNERRDGLFIGGPIPVAQMTAAIASGHIKAPLMLLAIKFRADTEQIAWVTPPMLLLTDWQFSASDRSRSIAALEKAGLLEVRRRRGRPPLVRLVSWKGGSNGRSSISA
jgi:hypothetical protein